MASWLMLIFATIGITAASIQDATSIDTSATAAAASPPPSPTTVLFSTSTSFSARQTHTIQVGLLDHKMRPETTEAAVGDIIEFDFYPLNHSIVRAEYGFPCIPYEMTGSDRKGFFSGFKPVDKVMDSPPKYSIIIEDTEPIFFYCSAPGSCITYGMVGGINLNSTMSIDKQRTLAMDSAYMLQPGELFPAESPLPSSKPASSILPSSSITSTPIPPLKTPSSSGLSKGAIVGIVVAGIVVILLGALLFFCWGRTKSLREEIQRKDGTVRRVSTSPNQMVEYKQPNVHVKDGHAHHPTQGFNGFAAHPGSPPPGMYGHQHQPSVEIGYCSTNYPAKYTTPTPTHPAYHTVSPGSPPPPPGSNHLMGQMYAHPGAHDPSPRGTPAPDYYETFPGHGQGRDQRSGPVEMNAITVAVRENEDHWSNKF